MVDVGARSGILSFFARRSIDRNGSSNRVKVVEGDASMVELPDNADVVVTELDRHGAVG
ncbi:MAG: hypothetical protein WBP81_25275 [Solirubrobacteraceae bacterium]